MGCSPEDLLEAMDGREGWRERVRDIRAVDVTWWWYIYIYIYIYIYDRYNELDVMLKRKHLPCKINVFFYYTIACFFELPVNWKLQLETSTSGAGVKFSPWHFTAQTCFLKCVVGSVYPKLDSLFLWSLMKTNYRQLVLQKSFSSNILATRVDSVTK